MILFPLPLVNPEMQRGIMARHERMPLNREIASGEWEREGSLAFESSTVFLLRAQESLASGDPAAALAALGDLLASTDADHQIASRARMLLGHALIGLRRWSEAEASLRSLRDDATADPPTLALTSLALARLFLESGRADDAAIELASASDACAASEDPSMLGEIAATSALARALVGDRDEAARGLRRAVSLLDRRSPRAPVYRAWAHALEQLELGAERVRAGLAALDTQRLGRMERELARTLDGYAIVADLARGEATIEDLDALSVARVRAPWIEVRLATLAIRRAADCVDIVRPVDVPSAADPVLLFDATSDRYELCGALMDFSERPLLARLVAQLVERRLRAPGESVATLDLLEAGWPGERATPAAARTRLHSAVRRLRVAGLGDHLLATSDGYLLAPSLALAPFVDDSNQLRP